MYALGERENVFLILYVEPLQLNINRNVCLVSEQWHLEKQQVQIGHIALCPSIFLASDRDLYNLTTYLCFSS